MGLHSDSDVIKLGLVLAKEALKLEGMCKAGEKDDRVLEYQLSQVAQLARQVTSDTLSYDKNEDDNCFGGGC